MNLKKCLQLGICGAAIFAVSVGGNIANAADTAPKVRVTGGTIQGYLDSSGVKIFKGIPYADTTAGENRWKAPQPVKAWRGVKDCTNFSQIAVQNNPQPFACWSAEYVDAGMTLENGMIGEDCLSVNV